MMTDPQEEKTKGWWKTGVQQALSQAFSDAKQARETLGDEVKKRYRHIVDKTTTSSEEFQRVLTDFKSRLYKNSEELEKKVQESVKVALEKVREPLSAELETLRQRADEISKKVAQMTKKGEQNEESNEISKDETITSEDETSTEKADN